MKKIILFSAVALWLLVVGGCEKEKIVEYEAMNLTNNECEKAGTMITTINKQGILLFDDTKTSQKDIQEIVKPINKRYEYAIYIPKKNSDDYAYGDFVSVDNLQAPYYAATYKFCNFPNEIKTINIPKTGLYISFSGSVFGGSWIGFHTSNYLVLTSLKIEKI